MINFVHHWMPWHHPSRPTPDPDHALNRPLFFALQYDSARGVVSTNVPPSVFSSAGFSGMFTLLSYPAPPSSSHSPATTTPVPRLESSDSTSDASSSASPASSTPTPLRDESQPSPSPYAAIGGGVAGGLLVLALGLTAYCLRRRRRQSKRQVAFVEAAETGADALGPERTNTALFQSPPSQDEEASESCSQSTAASVHDFQHVSLSSGVSQQPMKVDPITGSAATDFRV